MEGVLNSKIQAFTRDSSENVIATTGQSRQLLTSALIYFKALETLFYDRLPKVISLPSFKCSVTNVKGRGKPYEEINSVKVQKVGTYYEADLVVEKHIPDFYS